MGLLIGLITAAILGTLALLWALFNWALGPTAALVAVTVVVLVTISATLIDWATEK